MIIIELWSIYLSILYNLIFLFNFVQKNNHYILLLISVHIINKQIKINIFIFWIIIHNNIHLKLLLLLLGSF